MTHENQYEFDAVYDVDVDDESDPFESVNTTTNDGDDDEFVELTPQEYQDLMSSPKPPKRSIKQTTGYALGGLTVGTALAAIVVWLLSQIGVDATEIQEPLGFVLQAAGVTFGGWAAPPTQHITE